MDKFSYSVGVILANNLQQQNISGLNADDLAKGIDDALNGKAEIPVQQADQIVQQTLQSRAAEMHGGVLEAGQEFLAANGAKEGVTTLPSGLQYQVLTEGSGTSPSLTSEVTTHYHGTLIDGTVFDSSVKRGQPATFPVNGVISGWTEALQMMKEGSKWRLFIPHNLAYGERGAGQMIKPFSTLVFDVELLKVN